MRRLSLRSSVTLWALLPLALFGLIILALSIAWSWREVQGVVNQRNEKLAQIAAQSLLNLPSSEPPELVTICATLGQLANSIEGMLYVANDEGLVVCTSKDSRLSIGDYVESDLRLLIAQNRAGSLSDSSRSTAHIASAAPISNTEWNIVIEESRTTVFASTYSFLITMSALMLAVLVISFVILWFGFQRIVEPLSAVTAQAERVAAGRVFEPPDVRGPIEVEALIEAFNHMVTQLRQQQNTLQHYASRVLSTQEEERKRISRDLHDETAQELVGLLQRVELCKLDADCNPSLLVALDELSELAASTLLGVRRMSRDLRPLILEDLGLVAAAQTISDEVEQQLEGTRASCEVLGIERRLPPDTELTAFRIVQEALTNVRKHATTATRVYVTIQFEPDDLLIRVEDNGPGFVLHPAEMASTSGHLGLMGMKERAELLNGELEILSQSGEGTQVLLRLPL